MGVPYKRREKKGAGQGWWLKIERATPGGDLETGDGQQEKFMPISEAR